MENAIHTKRPTRRALALALLSLAFPIGSFASPLILLQSAHDARVAGLASSPDGRYLFSRSEDGCLKLWDRRTGKALRSETGVSAFALSPDGSTLFLAKAGALGAYAFPGDRLLASSPASRDPVARMAVSPDGSKLAVAGEWGGFAVLDASTLKALHSFAGSDEEHCTALAFSPDGKRVAAGMGMPPELAAAYKERKVGFKDSKNRRVVLADLEAGESLDLPGSGPVSALAFTPDGRSILYASYDRAVAIRELANLRKSRSFSTGKAAALDLAFLPDAKRMALVSENGTLSYWDFASGKELSSSPCPGASVLLLSRDGKLLTIGAADGLVQDREIGGDLPQRTFGVEGEPISALAFDSAGRAAFAIAGPGSILRWDLGSGTLSRRRGGPSAPVRRSAYVPGSPRVLVGLDDRGLELWDLEAAKLLRSFGKQGAELSALTVSPDGSKAIAGFASGAASLLDLKSGASASLGGLSARVTAAGFKADGSAALAGAADGSICLWKLPSRSKISSFAMPAGQGVAALAFHAEAASFLGFGELKGDYAKDSGRYGATPWEFDLEKKGAAPEGSGVSGSTWGEFPLVVASPDGRLLAGAGRDSFGIYNASSRSPLREYPRNALGLRALAFSPDGKRLVAGNANGSLEAYSLGSSRLLASALSLSTGEWIAWTPEGFFDGSSEAADALLCAVEGLEPLSLDQLFERFHRPDIVASRLALQAAALRYQGQAGPLALPPTVSIEGKTKSGAYGPKSEDWLVEEGRVALRATARDTGGGIDGLRLFCNGKAIGSDIAGLAGQGRRELTADFALPLASGRNEISLVGFSRDRTQSLPARATLSWRPAAERKPDLYLLVAGSDEYRNPKYALNYAAADASGFRDALGADAAPLFGALRVQALLGPALSRDSLTAALRKAAAEARPDDVFVFFYAGHGIALSEARRDDFYLVLPEVTNMADQAQLGQAALSAGELRDLCAAIPATRQLLVVDACNSGALASRFAAGAATRGAAEEMALAQLARSSGQAVFTAATDKQFASEIADLGHGVFTYALIQGLAGKAATADGKVTVASLKAWVDEEVPILSAARRGSEQYPTTFLFGQDFPLGLAK